MEHRRCSRSRQGLPLNEARSTAPADREAGVRHGLFLVIGFGVIAITNAIAITASIPRSGGIGLRAALYLFDAAETIGIGVALGAVIGLWIAFVRAPRWASLAAYAGFTTAVLGVILGQTLERQADVALEGRMAAPLFVIYLSLTGLGVVAAHIVGTYFSRFRRLRFVAIALAMGGIVVNHLLLRDDYPDVHGAIAWGAATLSGTTLGPLLFNAFKERASRRARVSLAAAIVLIGAAGLFIPPPNRVRIELFRSPGAVGPWLLAGVLWSPPAIARSSPPPASPWFADRSSLPPVPPSSHPLIARPPVVVFITIDAVRADAIADAKNDRVFPCIARLKSKSAYFIEATSPGTQTAVSLTSVFSGKYFSQLFWGMHGRGSARFAYASDDPSPRVPELLTSSGVRTMTSLSLNFLASDFGVLRGFSEELMIAEGRKHALAAPVIDPIIDRLEKLRPDQPAFFYAHLTEPHAPYDRGSNKGSDRDRYISEIGVADVQIARVVRVLEERFPDRGLLILSSDHGEAFGEHGTFNHTKTLYEELLRVPLLVSGAGVRPRRIGQRVGLLDIGPTILDIFGVPSPASFMGQSLVPLLRGENPTLERPILAEGRLRQALYWGNLKVIEDRRRKLVEVYDLNKDPKESDELFSKDRARSEPALAALRAFFEAHSARAPGYEAPYKP